MFYDRFDIAEAYYLFLAHYHEGQGSNKYQRLSKMARYFKPGPLLSVETLTENGREIYEVLVRTEKTTLEARDVLASASAGQERAGFHIHA